MGGDGHDSAAENEGDAMNSSNRSDNDKGFLIPTGSDDATSTKKRATRKTASHTNGSVPGRRRVRKTKEGSDENVQAKFIKYAALFLLVAQMVGLVLLMRYSRTSPRGPDEPLYLASTAVFIMEIMKLVICLFVVAYQSGSDFLTEIHHHVIGSPIEIVKLCVPSLLYTVQNNLLYLALTNLDAATYQVCYQLKILTTALFSALLLQRKFSATKWASLVVLTVGVAIVQLSGSGDQHSNSSSATDTEHHQEALERADQAERQNRWIGLIAVLCAACTSGFSGVYFGESRSFCPTYYFPIVECGGTHHVAAHVSHHCILVLSR
jgi:drug/metabolite transporter (DMT)-like permease